MATVVHSKTNQALRKEPHQAKNKERVRQAKAGATHHSDLRSYQHATWVYQSTSSPRRSSSTKRHLSKESKRSDPVLAETLTILQYRDLASMRWRWVDLPKEPRLSSFKSTTVQRRFKRISEATSISRPRLRRNWPERPRDMLTWSSSTQRRARCKGLLKPTWLVSVWWEPCNSARDSRWLSMTSLQPGKLADPWTA